MKIYCDQNKYSEALSETSKELYAFYLLFQSHLTFCVESGNDDKYYTRSVGDWWPGTCISSMGEYSSVYTWDSSGPVANEACKPLHCIYRGKEKKCRIKGSVDLILVSVLAFIASKGLLFRWQCASLFSGGSRISRGGSANLVGGRQFPTWLHFVNLDVKMEESGPLGWGRGLHVGWPPRCANVVFFESRDGCYYPNW